MKLLFATDGSEYSEIAAKFLANLTFSPDDEITILHVIGWVPPKGDIERYYAGLKELKQEIAPKIIDHAVNILTHLIHKFLRCRVFYCFCMV